jgi:hypothetical protein
MAKSLEHQIVALARLYIADEQHWTQGRLALRRNDTPARPHADNAWRWCAGGALIRAGYDLTRDLNRAYKLRDAACARLLPDEPKPVPAVEEINDSDNGHRKILRLFDDFLAHE